MGDTIFINNPSSHFAEFPREFFFVFHPINPGVFGFPWDERERNPSCRETHFSCEELRFLACDMVKGHHMFDTLPGKEILQPDAPVQTADSGKEIILSSG